MIMIMIMFTYEANNWIRWFLLGINNTLVNES